MAANSAFDPGEAKMQVVAIKVSLNHINNLSRYVSWLDCQAVENPPIKRCLGLKREAKDPQYVDVNAAAKLGAPMINPSHMSVSREEYGLMLNIKKGRNIKTKLKVKAIPNWAKEMKRTF